MAFYHEAIYGGVMGQNYEWIADADALIEQAGTSLDHLKEWWKFLQVRGLMLDLESLGGPKSEGPGKLRELENSVEDLQMSLIRFDETWQVSQREHAEPPIALFAETISGLVGWSIAAVEFATAMVGMTYLRLDSKLIAEHAANADAAYSSAVDAYENLLYPKAYLDYHEKFGFDGFKNALSQVHESQTVLYDASQEIAAANEPFSLWLRGSTLPQD